MLIVDDMEENRYMLESLLRGYGYEVKSANDGVEALEKASQEDFDMIISDILMPRMDGFQLCREVKKDKRLKKIPFIVYTATYTDPDNKKFALSLGAERFITKPTEPDVFIGILKEVIGSFQSGKLLAGKDPLKDETVFMKEYNEQLIKKLEDKMIESEKLCRELKESEGKYRELIDNANDAVIVVEKNGYMSFVNHKFTEMTGYSIDEAKEMHFSKLIYPDDLGRATDYFKRGLAGEEIPRNYEIRLVTKKGKTIYIENNISIIERKDRIVGVLAIVRDVTERKQAEEEKEKLQAQLLQAQKMEAIGTLTGGIAHDFNNLLTAIQGYTEISMLKLNEDDIVYKNLNEVKRASTRAANLTHQLLLFSRNQPVEMIPLDLNKTVKDMMSMVSRLIGEDISMIIDPEENLWTIKADPGNIEQVIMNLMVNARDAMPGGGKVIVKTENIEVDENYCRLISSARPGKFVHLSIADSGTGMDKETIEHIFEPFFTTKRPEEGTGLGLSAVYGIILQHGGWVNVYSEPGRGSVFSIFLPAFSMQPQMTDVQRLSLADFQGRGERILLVEDEEIIRNLNAETLKEYGYITFLAASAEEALEIFERENQNFDLVFSDVVLPNKSGLQLLNELLSRNPEIHVLLSSGYNDEKSLWQIIQKRGFRFLQKPYSLSDLLRTIRETLESK